ncbi:MAG: small multi-drug export protein [Flavobacteriaceae bacterium]|nr:small multi-drug export protein [Flavobacteriaceae bacterium]
MIIDYVIAFLWSISPLGEAKVGIPFALLKGLNPYMVFLVCYIANLLVYPIMLFFLETINRHFVKWRPYKKGAIFVAKRAKKGTADKIEKYGYIGLLFFVMLPVPGTGVYAGSIATYLFNMERKKAFIANAVGIFFSSVIIWTTTMASMGKLF